MMVYRTRTYIAGDWTGDSEAIQQLYTWNESDYWQLHFIDAHHSVSARDSSLNCSIKKSLKQRMDASKQFVLIVGEHTDTITAGSCHLCSSYNSWHRYCARGHSVDFRSFVKYECDKAVEAGIKIVILYNSTYVSKCKCPKSVRDTAYHIPMMFYGNDGKKYWNYQMIRDALQ